MRTLLWLDDLRNPVETQWIDWIKKYSPECVAGNDWSVVWVRSFIAFTIWITQNGLPDKIAFDHDLGEDIAKAKVKVGVSKRQARREKRGTPTGYDAAKWLVEYCIDNNKELPPWVIQSANPVGAENINKYLINYLKHNE